MDRQALMEAIGVVVLTDGAAEIVPDGPDAEMIRLCKRLLAVQIVYVQAHKVIDDDDDRTDILEPLEDCWAEIDERLRKLGGPTTLEGARAAAQVFLTYDQGITDLAGLPLGARNTSFGTRRDVGRRPLIVAQQDRH